MQCITGSSAPPDSESSLSLSLSLSPLREKRGKQPPNIPSPSMATVSVLKGLAMVLSYLFRDEMRYTDDYRSVRERERGRERETWRGRERDREGGWEGGREGGLFFFTGWSSCRMSLMRTTVTKDSTHTVSARVWGMAV